MTTRRVIVGAGALAGGGGIGAATGVLFWAIVARVGGGAQLGQATTAITAATLLGLLIGQPLAVALGQQGRTFTASQTWQATLLTSRWASLGGLALTILVTPLLVVVTHLHANPVLLAATAVLAAASAAGIVLDQGGLVAHLPAVPLWRSALLGVGKLGLVAALAASVHLTAAQTVTSWALVCAGTSCGALRSLRFPGPSQPEDRARVRAALTHRAGTHTMGVLAGSLPPQGLPLLVAAGVGTTAAGGFSLSWLIAGILLMATTAICSSLLAVSGASAWIAGVALTATLTTGAPLLWWLGPKVLVALHPDLAGYTPVLHVLLLAAIPNAIANLAVVMLRCGQHTGWVAGVSVGEALVVVGVATYAVAGGAGPVGVGQAWLLGQTVSAVLGVSALGWLSKHRRLARATQVVTP